MFKKCIGICSLLAVAMLAVGLGSARASIVVYDSISIQPTNGVEPITPSERLAQEFTTNILPSGLDSVTLLMNGTGTATVSIYTNFFNGSSDVPGSLVSGGTLMSPVSYNSSTLTKTVFTASGLILDVGPSYWVVLEVTTGSFNWSYGNFNAKPAPNKDTTQYGLWYSDPPNAFLHTITYGAAITDSTAPFQMAINASNPSTVPEPSTYVLLVIALGAVGFARKKMNRREG